MSEQQTSTPSSPISRRAAIIAGIGTLGGVAGVAAFLRSRQTNSTHANLAYAVPQPPIDPHAAMSPGEHDALLRPGDEKIAILLYPQFTALDVIGPHHVFINMVGAKVQLVAKSMEPVPTDTGYSITPNATFRDIRDRQTLILVPGGTTGTLDAMQDEQTMRFLRVQGETAEWVGSVCTGSLLLAAAGLLDGYRATSHWLTRDALKAGGAIPVAERYVEDRNRVTGGGVTAGIDFGLHLVEKWRGATYAKGVQMFMEYDPQPPFNSGSPTSPDAEPAMAMMLQAMHEPFGQQAARAIQVARGG